MEFLERLRSATFGWAVREVAAVICLLTRIPCQHSILLAMRRPSSARSRHHTYLNWLAMNLTPRSADLNKT